MAVLFLINSVVLLAIYFASAHLVVSFVGSRENSDSLSGGLKSSSKNIDEFFEGIEVANGLNENIDSLLEYLQISKTLQDGELCINELTTARDTAYATLATLDTLKKDFEYYENELDSLKNKYKELLKCETQPDLGCQDIDKLKALLNQAISNRRV
ncbi:hypothetical protein Aperf_G00000045638 [Anoplocephala perfoliata]